VTRNDLKKALFSTVTILDMEHDTIRGEYMEFPLAFIPLFGTLH